MLEMMPISRFVRKSIRAISMLLAVITLIVTTAPSARAQTFTVLHYFCTQTKCVDGDNPQAVLVQATNGFLYGTAATDGANDGGAVFRMTLSGSLTPLYNFADDYFPQGIIQATNGNLYGTTLLGGNQSGSIYELTSGNLTNLYSFCSKTNCADGGMPNGLVQAVNGYFYGTTQSGGKNDAGTVFKISPTGALTTVYTFCSQGATACTDGSYPKAALIQASNGDLYGTTAGGSVSNGTAFELTNGVVTTLYTFPAGASPEAPLLQGSDGNFYGTTYAGGPHNGGTVFQLTPAGALTTLYNFCSHTSCADGNHPVGALIQATDGSFYGTTYAGGAHQGGTLFKIAADGTLTTLYSLCSQTNCVDGKYPEAGLMQATNGSLYGTASSGGACPSHKCGTAFSLNVGLGPFVALQTSAGTVGATVRILGTNLTGASSVTFNGVSASFTVNSTGSSITTTVPAGATTGVVQVVTPTATLNSNAVYTVK